MDWFPILFLSGPIGLGVFLAGLGVLFWGIGKARETDRKEKESERSEAAPRGGQTDSNRLDHGMA